MANKTQNIIEEQFKKDLPDIRSGDTVKVFQIIPESADTKNKKKGNANEEKKDGDKKAKVKTQIFEGLVLARKHGKGIQSTITVRKIISGIGLEKIFPVHSPMIEKFEIVKIPA